MRQMGRKKNWEIENEKVCRRGHVFFAFVDTALYNEERCERCVGRDEWQYRHTVCHSTSL